VVIKNTAKIKPIGTGENVLHLKSSHSSQDLKFQLDSIIISVFRIFCKRGGACNFQNAVKPLY
jgi:hypothetical protein